MIHKKFRPWMRLSAEQVAVVCALCEPLTILDEFGALALVVCATALLGLPLRQRHPVTVLCATLPAMLTGHLLLPSVVAMYTVASTRPQLRLLWPCGLLFVAALRPWPMSIITEMTRTDLLNSIEEAALLSIGPAALGLLARARAESQEQLARLKASRAREQRLVAEQAVVRERARLARDMHDTVSHHISIIAVQAGALWAVETDPGRRTDMESIRRHSVGALEELRAMVGVLRGSGAVVATTTGHPRLVDVVELVTDSGLDITVDLPALAECPWPSVVETTAYWIIQESLSNVRKHAPGASVAVSAVLSQDGKSIVVVVRNGPAGRCPEVVGLPAGGHGLLGMKERAEQLGGHLSAGSDAEGGFLVRAVLPALQ
ncbi:sensor histidine kinase [Streptomyces wuyuanensis]|uniref:sensor histidine kinase n=1 Tax=Streptomyces wuyuanensis TaxID=1196353 RepID=UPI0034372612